MGCPRGRSRDTEAKPHLQSHGEELLPFLAVVLQAPLPVLRPAGLPRGQPAEEAFPVLGRAGQLPALGGLEDETPGCETCCPTWGRARRGAGAKEGTLPLVLSKAPPCPG